MSDSGSGTSGQTTSGSQNDRAARSVDADSPSPGKLLAAGRQSRELTVEEVGDALNLAPQTVNWLEADNYASLPAPAFTQGYIRNYAKHVGLDADAVVAAYQLKAGKPDVAWESPRSNAGITELVQRYPGLLISVVVAAVVLLIVIVLAVVWPDGTEDPDTGPEGSEPTTQIDSEDTPDSTLEQAAPSVTGVVPAEVAGSATRQNTGAAASRAADSRAGSSRFDDPGTRIDRDAIDPNDPLAHLPVAKTYPVSAAEVSRTPVISSADSGATDQPAADDVPRVEGSNYRLTVNRRLTPEGSDEVRLEVVEDCWISIKSVAGEELYAALGRSGQTINLTGEGPFRVLLGYAPGASLYLDNRQILLQPYTRNNVASLVIGQ